MASAPLPAAPRPRRPVGYEVVEGLEKLRNAFLLSILAIVVFLAAIAMAGVTAGLSKAPRAFAAASASLLAAGLVGVFLDLAAALFLFKAARTFWEYDRNLYGKGWTGVKLLLGGLALLLASGIAAAAGSAGASLALMIVGAVAVLAGYVYLALFLKDLAYLSRETGIQVLEKLDAVGTLYLVSIVLALTVILAFVAGILALVATIMGYAYTNQALEELHAKITRPPGAPPPIQPR